MINARTLAPLSNAVDKDIGAVSDHYLGSGEKCGPQVHVVLFRGQICRQRSAFSDKKSILFFRQSLDGQRMWTGGVRRPLSEQPSCSGTISQKIYKAIILGGPV